MKASIPPPSPAVDVWTWVSSQHIAVDGSTACIPGQHIQDGGVDEEGFQRDAYGGSPLNNNTMNRGMNSSTSTCPVKKTKSPMVKVMTRMFESFQATNAVVQKVMQGDMMTESINKAMQLVRESGVEEGSAEHFVATELLVKPEYRAMFFTITTNEGRLARLKRWCKKKNID